jgi:hypothetical protein
VQSFLVLRAVLAKQDSHKGLVLQVRVPSIVLGVDMAKQRPKDKGTAAETAIVRWAAKHRFHNAERLALSGQGDKGDVRLCLGVMIQVKDGYTDKIKSSDGTSLRDRKEPTDYKVGEWLKAAEAQAKRGKYDIWLLVHKRYGNADPDMWRWFVDGQILAKLLNIPPGGYTIPYVQLQGYMIPLLLRNAGVKS